MLGYSAILFFLALPALHAARPSSKFEMIGSRLFYIEKDTTLNWLEALRTCHRMGGRLASIRNHRERNLIVPKLERDSKYWLSVNDLAHEEGTFVSILFTRPFSIWRHEVRDYYHSNEKCVVTIENEYNRTCNSKALFICEA